MKFIARLTAALLGAVAAAVLLSPFAAVAVAHAGFRFPFPRIFDRTVMVTVLLVMVWQARALRLGTLVSNGFAKPGENLSKLGRGLAVALAAMMVLLVAAMLATPAGSRAFADAGPPVAKVIKYVLAALVIGIIEEGFFRAFLLGGMIDDFGRTGALIVSSAIYAVTHVIRSHARFYVTNLQMDAGWRALAAGTSQLRHLPTVMPELIGLFLLGLVLGRAYLATRTVYFSIGLHAGLVLGVKLWPRIVAYPRNLPHWLSGYAGPPLIGGIAAWLLAASMLVFIRPLIGHPPSTRA